MVNCWVKVIDIFLAEAFSQFILPPVLLSRFMTLTFWLLGGQCMNSLPPLECKASLLSPETHTITHSDECLTTHASRDAFHALCHCPPSSNITWEYLPNPRV